MSSIEISEILTQAKDGRDFFLKLEKHLNENDPSFSYANLARRCDFASRAFMREVFLGKKKLSPSTYVKFAKGLGLSTGQKKILKLILMLDNPSLNLEQVPLENIRKQIQKLNEKAKRAKLRTKIQKPLPQLDGIQYWPQIYAGLTENESLGSLSKKTGFSASQLRTALDGLIHAGLVEEKERGFPKAVNPHLVLDPKLFKSIIQKSFIQTLKDSIQQADKDFQNEANLYLFSTLSIRSEKIKELKAELQELIYKFADDHESAKGDRVISIGVTLI